MKTRIEFDRITRKYFFFPDRKNRAAVSVSTRKADIERTARRAGFTEIEFMTRPLMKDLRRLGYSDESARWLAREYYK